MPHAAFGQEWVDAWAAEIRASEEYRNAAQRWTWPLVFILRANPIHGIASDRRVYLDVRMGECHEARPGTADDAVSAEFVLSADAPTWKDVLDGTLDPVSAIMRGRVRLEKGSMTTLAMHTAAARALVGTAARVGTVFPDAV